MEFSLIKSFDIDHNELDGLSAQEIFVLGYELALIDHKLELPNEIVQMVHAENRFRIEKSCMESGRRFLLTWLEGDQSESWLQLNVEPLL